MNKAILTDNHTSVIGHTMLQTRNSKRPRHILTDCDGCLLNWINGFEQFMEAKGYEKIPETDAEYNIGKRYPITYEESRKFIREYNESEMMKDLQPMANAAEYVKKLHDKHGFKFTVVTAMSSHPNAHTYRTENLEKHFGKVFKEIKCLDIGANKYKELQRWADTGFFWIEDHVAQALAGHESGLNTLLINDKTNARVLSDPLTRVTDWKEIYDIVCDSYGLKK